MAALILPNRQVQQPNGAPTIDWSNPIAQKLVSAWFGNDCNAYGPRYSTPKGAATVVGSPGFGRSGFSTGTNTELPAGYFGTSVAHSRFAIIRVPSGGARNITSTSITASMQIRCNNGDLVLVEKANAARITASGVMVTGEICSIGGSQNTNRACLYKNGKLLGSPYTGGTLAAPGGTPVIGQDGSGGNFFVGGEIFAHFAWSRELSADEFVRLHANPWQIFAGRLA